MLRPAYFMILFFRRTQSDNRNITEVRIRLRFDMRDRHNPRTPYRVSRKHIERRNRKIRDKIRHTKNVFLLTDKTFEKKQKFETITIIAESFCTNVACFHNKFAKLYYD